MINIKNIIRTAAPWCISGVFKNCCTQLLHVLLNILCRKLWQTPKGKISRAFTVYCLVAFPKNFDTEISIVDPWWKLWEILMGKFRRAFTVWCLVVFSRNFFTDTCGHQSLKAVFSELKELSKLVKYFTVWCRDLPDTPDDVGSVLKLTGSISGVLSLHWTDRFVTALLMSCLVWAQLCGKPTVNTMSRPGSSSKGQCWNDCISDMGNLLWLSLSVSSSLVWEHLRVLSTVFVARRLGCSTSISTDTIAMKTVKIADGLIFTCFYCSTTRCNFGQFLRAIQNSPPQKLLTVNCKKACRGDIQLTVSSGRRGSCESMYVLINY